MKRLLPYLKNRYIYTPLALFIYIIFFDTNDLVSQINMRWQIYQTNNQIQHYQEDTEVIQRQIRELTTDPQALEKFAREQYRMKRDNEEIFIILKEPTAE